MVDSVILLLNIILWAEVLRKGSDLSDGAEIDEFQRYIIPERSKPRWYQCSTRAPLVTDQLINGLLD